MSRSSPALPLDAPSPPPVTAAVAVECPLASLLRNYLRVVAVCPQEQHLRQQCIEAATGQVQPLPPGTTMQHLGEVNLEALRSYLPPQSLLPAPRPSPSPAPCPPVPCEESVVMVDSECASDVPHSTDGSITPPCIAKPCSPLQGTELWQETMKACGLATSTSTSDSHTPNVGPSNVLSLLRQREQHCSRPCDPRLAPTPTEFGTNLTMRRVPTRMAHSHHYESRVFGAQFSHSGDTLAVATQDQHIRFYEVRAQPDSHLAECEEEQAGPRLFDSRTPPPGADDAICFDDEGDVAATPSLVPTTPLGPAGWPCVKDVHARHVGWCVVSTDFSHDDRFLVYSTWSTKMQLVGCAGDSDVHRALDLKPKVPTRFCVFSVQFSPDSRTVLGGSSDRHMYLYDLESDQRVVAAPAHCGDINAVAWADESGALIATASDDCIVKLWDRRCLSSEGRSAPVGCLVGHTQGIASICAKGDGRHLLTNSKDQTAKLWDVRRMCQPKDAVSRANDAWDYRWARFQRQPPTCPTLAGSTTPPVSLSPSPCPPAPTCTGVDLSLMTYSGHKVLETLVRAYFSPLQTTGQRYIYSGSQDGNIYIWDMLTGELTQKLSGHYGTVRDVCWHPDQPLMVSSSWDCSLARWECA